MRWLLAAVVALSSCGGGPDGPLFDSGWVLTGVVDQGTPADVPSPASNRWRLIPSGGCDGDPGCPDGPKLQGTDLCNSFTRSIRVDGDTVTWGTYWASTAAACEAVGRDPIAEFYRQPSFSFVIEGDSMRATSADGAIELVFTGGL